MSDKELVQKNVSHGFPTSLLRSRHTWEKWRKWCYVYNPSTPEAEAGELPQVWGPSGRHGKYKACQLYIAKSYLKTQTNTQTIAVLMVKMKTGSNGVWLLPILEELSWSSLYLWNLGRTPAPLLPLLFQREAAPHPPPPPYISENSVTRICLWSQNPQHWTNTFEQLQFVSKTKQSSAKDIHFLHPRCLLVLDTGIHCCFVYKMKGNIQRQHHRHHPSHDSGSEIVSRQPVVCRCEARCWE